MAKTSEIALSTKGLQIADRVSRKDFKFVCGSDTLVCDRFQAVFVSPRLADSLLSDPSIDEYLMDDTDSGGFKILSKLICGDSVVITEENVDLFLGLIDNLGNAELSNSILDFIDKSEELTISNCISRIKRRLRLGIGIENESCFIGSHISDIGIEELRGIESSVMSDILRSASLRVPSEDWLLNLIFELGRLHLQLLGDLQFEYLSPSGIDTFFERISISELDDGIWQQLWNRSRHRIVYDPGEIVWSIDRYSDFVKRTPESPWSGLIAHLTDLCGGNVHEYGVVTISCSSTRRNQCHHVVNYSWTDYWYALGSPNSWIQFDFKDRVVSMTHYSLKSDGYGGYHLVEWVVQGSMDGDSWTDLDRRKTQDLNNNFVTKIYSCDTSFSEAHFYRYIRLLQTGKDSSGYDYLMLANFECFGSMANISSIGFVSHGNPPTS
jgi:hypothetical protein